MSVPRRLVRKSSFYSMLLTKAESGASPDDLFGYCLLLATCLKCRCDRYWIAVCSLAKVSMSHELEFEVVYNNPIAELRGNLTGR